MKILHTADWHIGRSLYSHKRYDEFETFLAWLAKVIIDENIDALLVAGDIFDNSAPSNRSQELYYSFLCKIAGSHCRHVVVTSGNHDSPSFLNAPKDLLRFLNVHVVGAVPENIEDEVIVLKDSEGISELIVCAVPYLRDRDIRVAEPGESFEEKDQKLINGVRNHYKEVCSRAEKMKSESGGEVPIVAMGHLFVAGGKTIEGDGVRELYVGSLAHVGSDIFPPCIDYLALGHLHVPQVVYGNPAIRYSGSPLPMGFGEASQKKSVCVVDFSGTSPTVELKQVPTFQKMDRIKGDWEEISERLSELSQSEESIWLEVVYEGEEVKGDLRGEIEAIIEGAQAKVLRVKNTRIIERVLRSAKTEETLDDLDVNDVFLRCMDSNEIFDTQRDELLSVYREIVESVLESDKKAE